MDHSDVYDTQLRPRWVTTAEAADIISCARKTIYNMCDDGRLTRHYLGSRVLRIDRNEIDAILAEDTTKKSRAVMCDEQVERINQKDQFQYQDTPRTRKPISTPDR